MRLLLFPFLLLLMACQPTFLHPSKPSVMRNSTALNLSDVVFTFSRHGGFAGFCDELVVYADGRFTVSSCRGKQLEKKLSPPQLQQVNIWLETFAPFEFKYSDPPTVADGMDISWSFRGRGTRPMDATTQEQMQDFLSVLMSALYQP